MNQANPSISPMLHPEPVAAQSLFQNRIGVLATMHRKEQVIAPLMQQTFGLELTVPAGFNSDAFGTFTREVKRAGDQLQAARAKTQQAMQLTHHTIGMASEGSFGPHPAFPYLPCNREIVLLIDTANELELVGEAVSTHTNYSHRTITSLTDAQAFAAKVGFPEHGLIVIADHVTDSRPVAAEKIIKGITSEAALVEAVQWALAQSEVAHIETDMRALYNPSRMKVIAQATRDLIAKMNSLCPQCGTPGFAVVERRSGLPCGLCQLPTPLTRSVIYQCQKCGFHQESLFPDGAETADPTYCSYCNP
jgi:hypothetical protein